VLATLEISTVFNAADYIDLTDRVVRSANRLADVVLPAICRGDSVTVDFAGLKSVSSSYFNTLLSRIATACGVEAINNRLNLRFSSAAQRDIYGRSLAAVLRKFST
jgi:hypothetical protein